MSIPAASPFLESLVQNAASRLQSCREISMAAVRDGYIANARYEDMKRWLSGMFSDALDRIRDKHLVGGRPDIHFGFGSALGEEIWRAYPQLNLVNSMLGKARREPQNPYLSDIARLCTEMSAWVTLLGELKGKIAKRGDSRLESRPAQPVNPNQVRATCSCCFRNIAVASGGARMSHHGYERPELGWQTASCMGTMYKPYEVSCDGTKAMIQAIRQRIKQYREQASNLETATSIVVQERRTGRPITVVAGQEPFERLRVEKIASIRFMIQTAERSISDLEAKVASWRPTTIHGGRA
jgi:hypothetical protein